MNDYIHVPTGARGEILDRDGDFVQFHVFATNEIVWYVEKDLVKTYW